MTLVPRQAPLDLAGRTDEHVRVTAVRAATEYDADTLVVILHAYLRTASGKAARTSGHTLVAYEHAARRFVPWARDHGVTLLRPGRRVGGLYLNHLQTLELVEHNRRQRTTRVRRLAPRTVQKHVAGVRAFYRALQWADATDANPFQDVRPPKDPTPPIVARPPYRQEIDAVLPHCDPHETVLLLLCAHAGLRVGEALSLRWGDVEGRYVSVLGKGSKRRRVPVSDRLARALAVLERSEDASASVLPYANYGVAAWRLRKRFRQAGGRFNGFHRARKHAGTRLYQAVRDFTRVSLFLGHASEVTTRAYVEVEDHDVADFVRGF
ncbi:tyrosine-type recombinase/integrase [Deinococcus pimensis]|uniref:tyrosine-type recombinase/integrase n=1 Tax=Deinococcus pimensis TaxID=309888 RepID=UPI000483A965|nr:tyrosine-type recombinase/integrase [Deinococcus pimensis]